MSPGVSVIIVSYNVRSFLENLLASVRKSIMAAETEIIVVDNYSDDDSVDCVRKNYPEVRLIENKKNVGFGRANNQGAKIATGKYLVFVNPDAVVQENTTSEMFQFLENNPGVGAAGCRILNADGTLQKACRRSFPTPWVAFTKITGLSSLFPNSRLFGKYNLTFLSPDEPQEVDAISGSFMAIPREVFEKVGGFDEDYFMYGEDLDLCFRIKSAGYKVFYTPATSIIHFKGESALRSNFNRTREFYRAMSVFVMKRYTHKGFLFILKSAIYLNSMVEYLFVMLKKIWPVILDFSIAVAAMFVGEYLRSHRIYGIPVYGRPYFYLAPGLMMVLLGIGSGIYGENKFSFRLSLLSTFVTFLFFSSLTYFFKEFAFSRFIVLTGSALMVVMIPGWRLLYQLRTSVSTARHPVFGRKTLVVGKDQRAVQLIQKIRGKITMGFDIVGIISEDDEAGGRVLGIKVMGNMEDLPRLVKEKRIEDVLFASGRISYSEVLQAISSVKNRSVHFKLVPETMDVIIGKTYVDGLADVPLVDINYSISRRRNKVMKRLFDLSFVAIAGLALSPVLLSRKDSGARRVLRKLRFVLSGKWSVVGRSESYPQGDDEVFGKYGITGVAQLNRGQSLSEEEVEKLYVFYARNQSLWLDLEIVAKSFLQLLKPAS